jgi:hypothetical protein
MRSKPTDPNVLPISPFDQALLDKPAVAPNGWLARLHEKD